MFPKGQKIQFLLLVWGSLVDWGMRVPMVQIAQLYLEHFQTSVDDRKHVLFICDSNENNTFTSVKYVWKLLLRPLKFVLEIRTIRTGVLFFLELSGCWLRSLLANLEQKNTKNDYIVTKCISCQSNQKWYSNSNNTFWFWGILATSDMN